MTGSNDGVFETFNSIDFGAVINKAEENLKKPKQKPKRKPRSGSSYNEIEHLVGLTTQEHVEDRETYTNVCMAIHYELGDDGKRLAREFAKRSDKYYSPKENIDPDIYFDKQWASYDAERNEKEPKDVKYLMYLTAEAREKLQNAPAQIKEAPKKDSEEEYVNFDRLREIGVVFDTDVDKNYIPKPHITTESGLLTLLECGSIHQISGEPGIGKSLLSDYIAKKSMEQGGNVLFYDRESSSLTYYLRLEALGFEHGNDPRWGWTPNLHKDDIDQYVRFLWSAKNPEYSLVVVDSNSQWGLQQQNDMDKQSKIWTNTFKFFHQCNVSVLLIGHTNKEYTDANGKTRGGDFMGSVAVNAIPRVHYLLKSSNQPLNPDSTGYVVLELRKENDPVTRKNVGDKVAKFYHEVQGDDHKYGLYDMDYEPDHECEICNMIWDLTEDYGDPGRWSGSQAELARNLYRNDVDKENGKHISKQVVSNHINGKTGSCGHISWSTITKDGQTHIVGLMADREEKDKWDVDAVASGKMK